MSYKKPPGMPTSVWDSFTDEQKAQYGIKDDSDDNVTEEIVTDEVEGELPGDVGSTYSQPLYTQKVAANSGNPYFAYCGLALCGTNYVWVGESEHIISINNNREFGGTGSAVIEVYDDTGYEVEKAILETGERKINFWYGYSGGEESEHYESFLTMISSKMVGFGMILTLEATPMSALNSISNTATLYTGSPTDVVDQAAADAGVDMRGGTSGGGDSGSGSGGSGGGDSGSGSGGSGGGDSGSGSGGLDYTVVKVVFNDSGVTIYYAFGGSCSFPKSSEEYKIWKETLQGKDWETGSSVSLPSGLPGMWENGKQITIQSTTNTRTTTKKTNKTSTEVVEESIESTPNSKKEYNETVLQSKPAGVTEEEWQKTTGVRRYYKAAGQTIQEFVASEVQPYTADSSGEGNYQLVINDTDSGSTATYQPLGTSNVTYAYAFTIGQVSERIISFEPQYGEMLYASMGMNSSYTTVYDNTSGEMSTSTGGSGTVTYQKPPGMPTSIWDSFTDEQKRRNGVKVVSSSDNSSAYIGTDGYTAEEGMIAQQNAMVGMQNACYQATLVIKGQPNMVVGANVTLTVYTRDGKKHLSSGDYAIMSVEDLVDGSFTSTLQLLKMGGKYGFQGNLQDLMGGTGGSGWDAYEGGSYQKGQSLGLFTITGYCNCAKCCGKYSPELGGSGTTHSGLLPTDNHTIAVNETVWDKYKGRHFFINGKSAVFTVEDSGTFTGPNDVDHFDVYHGQHSAAVAEGKHLEEVWEAVPVAGGGGGTSGGGTVPEGVPKNQYSMAAAQYVGAPYQWGGYGNPGYDCSGLVSRILNDCGHNIGRQSSATFRTLGLGVPITGNMGMGSSIPGDVCCWSGHVNLHLGNGWVANAPGKGKTICIRQQYKTPMEIRRLI